jgi:hypothetical protein
MIRLDRKEKLKFADQTEASHGRSGEVGREIVLNSRDYLYRILLLGLVTALSVLAYFYFFLMIENQELRQLVFEIDQRNDLEVTLRMDECIRVSDIRSAAQTLGWKIVERDVDSVLLPIEFLSRSERPSSAIIVESYASGDTSVMGMTFFFDKNGCLI